MRKLSQNMKAETLAASTTNLQVGWPMEELEHMVLRESHFIRRKRATDGGSSKETRPATCP